MTETTVSDLITELFGAVLIGSTVPKAVWYDKGAGGYIWEDSFGANLVDDAFILNRMDKYHAAVGAQMQKQTERFIDGNITIDAWQERISRQLKDSYVVNLQLGRGGKAVTTFSDYGCPEGSH